jgi:CDP-diacylglycerol--serine O-phosphatidyltransferase
MTKHIPNLITCLNLVSGFISVILILNGNLLAASWVIILAMVFDFLDGFSARLLHAYSDMGKELDSLADLVSFGVAPGLIIYSLLVKIIGTSSEAVSTGHEILLTSLAVVISAFMVVCGGLRLAKFNTDTEQSTSFKGLPIPANALVIVSLIIASCYSESTLLLIITGSTLAIMLISISLSLLMVSRIDLLSLKFSSYRLSGNESRYILIGLSAGSVVIGGLAALPLIIPYYIAVSVVSSLTKSQNKI